MTHITRRTTLKHLALGAGGLLLPLSSFPTATPQQKLGIALVGLGNYATRQLGPALQHTQHCYLAGIVTGTPEKEKVWAEKYGIPAKNIYNYQTFDQIKDNPDIDIVYVVLPNFMHAEYTIRAAQAGKHVICEKPMALNAQEGEAMIQACTKAGVQLQIGYRLYFEPHHQQAWLMAHQGDLGEVGLVESSLGFSMANPDSWRLNKAKGGGGAIVDLGVYAIQGARKLIGEDPIRVTAQGSIRHPEVFKDIYETVTWQFEFPSGALSNSSTTYSYYVDRMYASGSQGWVELKPAFNATGAQGKTDKGVLSFDTPPFQQIAQMDEFALSIHHGTKTRASGEEGLKDLKIIQAIFEAADSGREVEIAY